VVVPQANGRREKKHNDRDAGCQTPAASLLQTAAWNHLFPHPAKLLQLTSTHADVQGCQEKRYKTRNIRTRTSARGREGETSVAHDVAVSPALVPPTEERLVEIHDCHVRTINVAVFKQSTAIAGRSRGLIASLSHSH
jgi:hypothetical protein